MCYNYTWITFNNKMDNKTILVKCENCNNAQYINEFITTCYCAYCGSNKIKKSKNNSL